MFSRNLEEKKFQVGILTADWPFLGRLLSEGKASETVGTRMEARLGGLAVTMVKCWVQF